MAKVKVHETYTITLKDFFQAPCPGQLKDLEVTVTAGKLYVQGQFNTEQANQLIEALELFIEKENG